MTGADTRFMSLALSLGRRGLGRTWPNPSVGCVVVKNGRIVGRGTTADGGRPHAEVVALGQAGEAAQGATVYVSLEPCAHHGKTPPCADALVGAGVTKVVVALGDPDPRVAGRGIARLREAGIAVTEGVLEDEARCDQAGFLSRVTRGRPTVTLKLATSFDGRIATATGESRWITGSEARRAVHAMRLGHDMVLVGGGTARADNPTLTVRGIGAARQPVRAVAARHLALPWPNRLIDTIEEGPVWLLHGDQPGDVPEAQRWRDAGARLIPVSVAGGGLDAASLMAALGREGITRVFCEGGGAFAASLLQADLVDDIVGFTAGLALGAEGQPSLGAMGIADLGEAQRFRLVDCRAVGGDVQHHWRRA